MVFFNSVLFAETLDLQGSVTIARFIRIMGKAYKEENPEVEIKITYVGPWKALEAVKKGDADAAMIIKRKFESYKGTSGINFIPLAVKGRDTSKGPDYIYVYGLAVKDSGSKSLQKFIDFIKSDKGKEVLKKTARRHHFTPYKPVSE